MERCGWLRGIIGKVGEPMSSLGERAGRAMVSSSSSIRDCLLSIPVPYQSPSTHIALVPTPNPHLTQSTHHDSIASPTPSNLLLAAIPIPSSTPLNLLLSPSNSLITSSCSWIPISTPGSSRAARRAFCILVVMDEAAVARSLGERGVVGEGVRASGRRRRVRRVWRGGRMSKRGGGGLVGWGMVMGICKGGLEGRWRLEW